MADFVWIICTPDFQVGYILGKNNIFGDSTVKYRDSYCWNNVRDYFTQTRAIPENFDY